MFNMHAEFSKFYKDHVRLNTETRKRLATYRDVNIERLKNGLLKLGYPLPVEYINQGSYAMYTTVQNEQNEFDIDIAVIFNKEDIPSSPYDTRKRVEEAMIKEGGAFKKPPEARTNAVTIWYQDNYHVDLAVHRLHTNIFGDKVYEHAGVDWIERAPDALTKWFSDEVNSKSPSKQLGANVEPNQMRRIVQLLKFFTKSRSSWIHPGGLLLSVLVHESYVSDFNRDDISFLNTLEQIYSRLNTSLEIYNPVYPSQTLTYKQEYKNQVRRLKEQLEISLGWLNPLMDANCEKLDAAKVWNKFFDHQYWADLVSSEAIDKQRSLEHARAIGSLFATESGRLVTKKSPDEKITRIEDHKFYGDE